MGGSVQRRVPMRRRHDRKAGQSTARGAAAKAAPPDFAAARSGTAGSFIMYVVVYEIVAIDVAAFSN
jgi:hypothetical protein